MTSMVLVRSTAAAALVAAGSILFAQMTAAHQAHNEQTPESQATMPSNDGGSSGMVKGQGMMQPMPGMANMRMPEMNAKKGRKLFVTKGCVACHSINGIGGHDAAALDAETMHPMMNPFDFAAKMWRMAPAMIAAQEEALGHQITFTGDELSDIVAFVHDHDEQHKFTEDDLTPEARHMMEEHHHEGMEGETGHNEEHHDEMMEEMGQ